MITEIKKLLKEDKLLVGTDLVTKALKNKQVLKVYLAKNTPEIVKDDLKHYGKIVDIEIVQTELTNEELGDICKKPFFISVLGVKV